MGYPSSHTTGPLEPTHPPKVILVAGQIVGLLSLCHSSGVDMVDVREKFLSETKLVRSRWHCYSRILFLLHKKARSIALADILVFVVRVDTEELIDALGYNVISALKAVGCPEVLCCLQGVEKLSGKKIIDMRQSVQRLLESALGSDVKIVDVLPSGPYPDLAMCRQLCNATPRVLAWKHCSFMLGDSIQVAFPAGPPSLAAGWK